MTNRRTMPEPLRAAVRAYLLARACAETTRARVDEVQRAILAESHWHVAPEWRERTTRRGGLERITDPGLAYLLSAEDQARYCAECDRRTRAAGLKPASMPDEHCPALVAEELQRQATALMIDLAAPFVGFREDKPGEMHHRLLCAGLDKRREFVDLLVKLALATPGFESTVRAAIEPDASQAHP